MMYGSIIIVNLSSKIKYKHIDSLQDLSNRKNVKILVQKNSFIEDSIKDSPEFSSLKGRIELFDEKLDPKRLNQLLTKLFTGSYALIDTKFNLLAKLSKLPNEEKCNFGIERFHFSKEGLFTQSVIWIFNKKMNSEMREMINLNLIWFQQTGLFSTLNLRGDSNSGISSPVTMNSSCPKLKTSKEESCPNKSSSSNGPATIKFRNVSNVFLLLTFGYLISFSCFVVECLTGFIIKFKSNSKTKVKNLP